MPAQHTNSASFGRSAPFCQLFNRQVNVSPQTTCIVVHGAGGLELRPLAHS
jgi:hypothetical protein